MAIIDYRILVARRISERALALHVDAGDRAVSVRIAVDHYKRTRNLRTAMDVGHSAIDYALACSPGLRQLRPQHLARPLALPEDVS